MPDAIVSLVVQGKEQLAPRTMNQLTSCIVSQRISEPAVCELVFAGEDSAAIGTVLKDTVIVSLNGEVIFQGDTVETETISLTRSGGQLRVRARDILGRLSRKSGTECFSNISLKSLADKMAASLGIAASAQGIHNPEWRHLVQYNETPLALLARACDLAGVGFIVRKQVLTLFDVGKGLDPEISIADGQRVSRLTVRMSAESDIDSCEAFGWESFGNKSLRAMAKGAKDRPSGRAIQLTDASPSDLSVLKAFADGTLARHGSAGYSFSASFSGIALLRPGARVSYTGSLRSSAIRGVASAVEHSFSVSGGYATSVDTSMVPYRERPDGFAIVQARVVSVLDPEKRGRVKVSYPALGGMESDWLNAALPGAGKSKGLAIMPDVGDYVVVGYNNANPAQGILLGSLYAHSDSPGDPGVSLDRFTKYRIDTRDGNSIVLSDRPNGIELRTRGGQLVTIDDSSIKVKLADGTGIEIDGDGIHAAAKRFEVSADEIAFAARKVDFTSR